MLPAVSVAGPAGVDAAKSLAYAVVGATVMVHVMDCDVRMGGGVHASVDAAVGNPNTCSDGDEPTTGAPFCSTAMGNDVVAALGAVMDAYRVLPSALLVSAMLG